MHEPYEVTAMKKIIYYSGKNRINWSKSFGFTQKSQIFFRDGKGVHWIGWTRIFILVIFSQRVWCTFFWDKKKIYFCNPIKSSDCASTDTPKSKKKKKWRMVSKFGLTFYLTLPTKRKDVAEKFTIPIFNETILILFTIWNVLFQIF